MKAISFVILFFLGSVFLAVASQNPYYIPSDKFQIRFQNENGQIRFVEKFNEISEHLEFLRYYRLVEYIARPRTVILPHHSDAEYLLIVTRGSAIITILPSPNPNEIKSVSLQQFDVLRVPPGAVCYTINTGGSNNDEDLELIKLALPSNNPGQFQNLYPSGNQNPTSFYRAFSPKILQAAFNAKYEEIKKVFWGSEQWEEGVIVKLEKEELRSVIRQAQSQLSSSEEEQRSTPIGPVRLRNINPLYSNDHGSYREAGPHKEYPPLQYLGAGAAFLKLDEKSMFLPHYNSRGIVLAYVAEGDGWTEMGSPYPNNKNDEQQQEGNLERLTAKISRRDLYIIPAGFPVAVFASENSNLNVVGFILNAPDSSRMFLTGEQDNVVKQINPALLAKSCEEAKKLLNRQEQSHFVNLENQPGGDDKNARHPKAVWYA